MVIYYHVRFRLYTLIAEVCMETKSGIQVTTPPAQHEFTNWLQKLYWTKSVISDGYQDKYKLLHRQVWLQTWWLLIIAFSLVLWVPLQVTEVLV